MFKRVAVLYVMIVLQLFFLATGMDPDKIDMLWFNFIKVILLHPLSFFVLAMGIFMKAIFKMQTTKEGEERREHQKVIGLTMGLMITYFFIPQISDLALWVAGQK
ncbi:hypothetical protein [Paenibacillus mucilaginosus]|uniref:hypothetical protein n=1 Tax=Paenibacillus mucilaginosus TaxID=61624 RepID=UPI003D1B99ED